MDERIPGCLVALGLGTEADERDVRRAYAQRLKRIDPATDPRAFQALREAYEQAQQWLWMREQARQAEAEATTAEAVEPAPAAQGTDAPAEPAAEPGIEPSIEPSGGTVAFESFAAVAAQGFSDEEAARRALQGALADERLINLEARALFEWNVGCLLMNGWQRGHEFLFTPAAELFGWSADRRHLRAFGRLGEAIDRAIDEKHAFFSQPRTEFEVQRRLVQRLRGEQMPSDVDLRLDVPLMHALLQRYPHWLRAITSISNAQRWRERFDQLPEVRYESVPAAGAQPPSAPGRSVPAWLVMSSLMLVLAVMARLIGSDTRPPRPALPGVPPPAVAPWAQPPPPRGLLWKESDTSFESVARPGWVSPAPAFQVPLDAPASAARRAAPAASSGKGTSPPRPGR